MENCTSKEELAEKFSILMRTYNENPYPSLAQRKEVLQALKKSFIAHENNFYQAL